MPIREAGEASEANETIGAQIGQVIDILQRRSVVVVGDLMLDKFVHGPSQSHLPRSTDTNLRTDERDSDAWRGGECRA